MSDIRPLTKQQCFDIVWNNYVLGDAGPGLLESSSCVLRTPSGAKCFVGRLIPDHVYRPWMDSTTDLVMTPQALLYMPPERLTPDQREAAEELRGIFDSEVTPDFLYRLQDCHDRGVYASDCHKAWRGELEAFARNEGLRIPEGNE